MKAYILLSSLVLLVFLIPGCKNFTENDLEAVEDPVFSLEQGIYYGSEQQALSIYCVTPKAQIRYTIDGSSPDANSELYESPIYLSSDVTIRAIALRENVNPSNIVTANYTIVSPSEMRVISSYSVLPDTIFSDNGLTTSNISVWVEDRNGFPVAGQVVRFQASIGVINNSSTTDGNGFATAEFYSSETGMADITAQVTNYSDLDPELIISTDIEYMRVVIHEVPPLSSLVLTLPSEQDPYPIGLMQTIPVTGEASTILGQSVPDNTMLTFSTSIGYFVDNQGTPLGMSIQVPVLNGHASVLFCSGSASGSGTLALNHAGLNSSRTIVVSP